MKIKSFLAAAASIAGILTLSSPASAVIYDWQFTNENGNFGDPTDVVAGFVEFDDADVFPGATGVSATNLQITSVTGLTDTSAPFFGDGVVELNNNLIIFINEFAINNNEFDFNMEEEINFFNFRVDNVDSNGDEEELFLVSERERREGSFVMFPSSFLTNKSSTIDRNSYSDSDSNSLQSSKQESASVPFEFSPTLGLFLAGSIFASRGYIKRCQARSITEAK